MSLPRTLAVGVFALALMVSALWAMDVNYAAWIGAWLSPRNQYPAGFGVITVLGLGSAWVYARFVGSNFPGPGMVRGVVFSLVLACAAIWLVPYTLEGIATAVGNTQVVYGGRGIHDDTPTADQQMQDAMTRVEPCPPIFGVKPPFAKLTRNKPWAPADGWRGRLIPFGIAFGLFGLVIGALLSEKFDNKRS